MFQENEKANDKCYVVLRGRVGVYGKSVQFDVKIDNVDYAADKKVTGDSDKLLLSGDTSQRENAKMLDRSSYYGDLVAELTFGCMFGQAGILNDDKRNASILTLESTELMVFHRSALEAIKLVYENKIMERREFVTTMIPEMQMINNPLRVMKLLEFFKPLRFKHGECITEQGVVSNRLYFVEEGEIIVSRRLMLPEIVENRKVRYSEQDVTITTIQDQAIIGEEILEKGSTYWYTTQVKSAKARVLFLDKTSDIANVRTLPVFSILLKGLRAKE